ncbi:MAG: Holliday junction resolvase RuvX [Acidimicrobiia bacterium]|nr:MAG: Holliday junction resolvase RuvX [Acidimicrobiia bacterium]
MSGRILGLDPGERRIGVAVADPTGTIASPDRYIDRTEVDAASAIRDLCQELDVSLVVIGLPLNLDGREGSSAHSARELGELVEQATGIEVVFQDERFTSKTAEAALISGGVRRKKRKETRDQVAAAVMLQSYLDRRRNDAGSGSEGEPLS